ncbi:MAG: biotin permease [Deltaproteobacteria bacterium SG8_13]|nr:MAG: biotin permease [Deltaproteobacteria bacterium SG8_13]
MTDSHSLRMSVFAALFAALTAMGAFIAVPIGPVPIVLQNLFVMLAGLLLGPRWGLASVGIYLLAGFCGLPVFAGGQAGIGRLIGPTGGYLIGYLPAVYIIGRMTRGSDHRLLREAGAMVLGTLLLYACGVSWLKVVTGLSWTKALAVGMLPFLIGDALKIAAAIPIARSLRPVMQTEVPAADPMRMETAGRTGSTP